MRSLLEALNKNVPDDINATFKATGLNGKVDVQLGRVFDSYYYYLDKEIVFNGDRIDSIRIDRESDTDNEDTIYLSAYDGGTHTIKGTDGKTPQQRGKIINDFIATREYPKR